MRFLGSTGWQALPAHLRWLVVCAVLVMAPGQSHHAFASEIGHDMIFSTSVDMVTSSLDHHSDDQCQGAGHCATAFVGITPAVSRAAATWGPFTFVLADAPPLHGLTVDPGQHPPKSVQLF